MKIKSIDAYEILDSRGNPTVEAKVELESGVVARASVPSGASTGSKEDLELRDDDEKRFKGKGVLKACENIKEKIFPSIQELDVFEQEKIDTAMIELDGTENKSNLGANSTLAVSLAVCRAGSLEKKVSLWSYIREAYGFDSVSENVFPVPMMNVINGGAHADSGLDIQEFMVVPVGAESFFERIKAGSEIYQQIKEILKTKNYRTAVGDEGGFAPQLESNREALEIITEAVDKAGYNLGSEIKTGIDAAASEFFDTSSGQYNLKLDRVTLDGNGLLAMYREWFNKYQLELIEDPAGESDWDGWQEMNKQLGDKIAIIGDDLITTDKKIVEEAAERNACNTVLIKVNQIGTLTEAVECIKAARKNNMKIAVSHRSGETTDDFISDLAFATGAEYVKFGAPARGERVCKYNRLVQIEREVK